jgi:hypothetical protein
VLGAGKLLVTGAPVTAETPAADLVAVYAAGLSLVREAIAGMTPEQFQTRPIEVKRAALGIAR